MKKLFRLYEYGKSYLKNKIQSTSNEVVLPVLIVVGASVVGTRVVGLGDVRSPPAPGF